MYAKPVPVDCSSLSDDHFKVDKKSGTKIPQMKKKLLDALIKGEVVQDYLDFFVKHVGAVQSPRNHALYLVWTAEGFDNDKDVWSVPSTCLKYFSIAVAPNCEEVWDWHGAGAVLVDMAGHKKAIQEDIATTGTVSEATLKSCGHRVFAKVFREEGGEAYLPRIDARAIVDFYEKANPSKASAPSPKHKAPAPSPAPQKTPTATTPTSDGQDTLPQPSSDVGSVTPLSGREDTVVETVPVAERPKKKTRRPNGSEDAVRDLVVCGSAPSTILDYRNGQQAFLDTLSKFLPEVTFSGADKDEIVLNTKRDWINSFSVANDGYNVLTEDEVANILSSRIKVKSYPPMAVKNRGHPVSKSDEKRCTFSMAGMDPSVGDGDGEGDDEDSDYDEDGMEISDEARIQMVQAIVKAIVIPLCSSSSPSSPDAKNGENGETEGEEPAWFQSIARELVANAGLPIERILSSPETIQHFFNVLMKQEDVRTSIAQLYLQHKMAGLVNHHICG
jgi:hypothetical protein